MHICHIRNYQISSHYARTEGDMQTAVRVHQELKRSARKNSTLLSLLEK